MTESEFATSEDPAAMIASFVPRNECAEHAKWRASIGMDDRKLRLWCAACSDRHPPSAGPTVWSWRVWAEDPAHNRNMTVAEGLRLWCEPDRGASQAEKAALIREIIGNPFRPVTLPKGAICEGCYNTNERGPASHGNWRKVDCPCCKGTGHQPCPWLTPDVLTLAESAYEERVRECNRCAGVGGHILIEGKMGPFASPANAMSRVDYNAGKNDFWRRQTKTHWQLCPDCHGTTDDGTLDKLCLGALWDALEEAGCDDQYIRDHLCGESAHVRGCWTVDIILGKS